MKSKERNKNRCILLACVAAFLLLVPSASREQPEESAQARAVLAVAFTGDVNGYIEPCG